MHTYIVIHDDFEDQFKCVIPSILGTVTVHIPMYPGLSRDLPSQDEVVAVPDMYRIRLQNNSWPLAIFRANLKRWPLKIWTSWTKWTLFQWGQK